MPNKEEIMASELIRMQLRLGCNSETVSAQHAPGNNSNKAAQGSTLGGVTVLGAGLQQTKGRSLEGMRGKQEGK